MASKSNLVNLDAMIKREDFAEESPDNTSFENFHSIPARELETGKPIISLLRKPDFQRETNHWSPEQLVSLLECYLDGDLIPSVILWKSNSYMFVIDGGHRLSALRSWVEDDYGDGHLSFKYFGSDNISLEQRKAATKVRKMINDKIGSWASYQSLSKLDDHSQLDPQKKKRLNTLTARGLSVQWVTGDVKKAETSFFNINMKGTPLDELEEKLLRNRFKPIPISARAIIRAGQGHKYWSNFDYEIQSKIESVAASLHATLFSPEASQPIKTLDLPLSGSKGVRNALQILIELLAMASSKQASIKKLEDDENDDTGSLTLTCLNKLLKLASRITGNDNGSLGLHPAVYFYGPSGRHSSSMFLGTFSLINEKLSNNDQTFFQNFIKIREQLERLLIEHKDLIAGILQRSLSNKRNNTYKEILSEAIKKLLLNKDVTEQDFINFAGFQGKILVGEYQSSSTKFTDDQKSQIFIYSALKTALKCPICNGYLDAPKSISYDHIIRVEDGGTAGYNNGQLSHPYCNQSIKN
ncbi:DUF262 domain-containing protein [Acinetobacter sp. PK01]|uniref:GmrSD restriction endonuclease domain-containing protein n=1 Tax=Acinetobacter sp. PK01 TaxID=2930198 RepID=UPI001FB57FA5|nr:DUF262 domain-containing protein [Acinetobacter sp. PK01]UOG17747.1 HNH endonuclease [Acinetobacter sp. PK01]